MKYTKLNIPDVILIQPQIFEDHRGFLWKPFGMKNSGKMLPTSHLYRKTTANQLKES